MKYIKWGSLLSILTSAFIFIDPTSYTLLGKAAWHLLCILMIIRPLSDVLPRFPILKKGVLLRKELGIASASFGIAHAAGFFLMSGMSPLGVFTNTSVYWGLTNFLTWGLLALLVSIPLLITSNLASMKLLKKNWKKLQYLSYAFFVLVALHLAFIHPSIESFVENFSIVLVWAVLWILSYKKIVLLDK